MHHTAFMTLKEAITQAPIIWYPDPAKRYIVHMDASDDACGVQLSQEHDGTKFPIAFLSHIFTESQTQWSTPGQEAYGVCCAITKWNYYLQGANIIVCKDHKLLAKFLNGKNTNNKVKRWGLELATYNITFKWMSGAINKAADCLSRFVELSINRKATIKCFQPQIWMDQHSTQEAKHHTTTKQLWTPNLQILQPSRTQFHQS